MLANNQLWLKHLICQKGGYYDYGIPFQHLIPFILWLLWKVHNKNCFENINTPPSTKTILQLSTEHFFLTNSTITKQRHKLSSINKIPPERRTFFLNTDRGLNPHNSTAGFEGFFRDHKGAWVMSYAGTPIHHSCRNRTYGTTTWLTNRFTTSVNSIAYSNGRTTCN